MTALLKVTEKMVGRADRRDFSVRLVSERVRARDVIAAHVEQEVVRQNADRWRERAAHDRVKSLFLGMDEHPVEAQLNGPGPSARYLQQLDPATEIEAATGALETRKIVMLFDDRHVEDLDEHLTVTDTSVVTFLRIVPLVAG
ncbi:MAG: hypothetical protein ACTS3R_03860 [Inquilinaceae bacterium]